MSEQRDPFLCRWPGCTGQHEPHSFLCQAHSKEWNSLHPREVARQERAERDKRLIAALEKPPREPSRAVHRAATPDHRVAPRRVPGVRDDR